jgi:tetratricopeptide (TPR) repeat protein
MRGPEDVVHNARNGASLEDVKAWMAEANVTDWLHLCEAAVFMGALDLVDGWSEHLTPAQAAVLEMVRIRAAIGRLNEAVIEAALAVCSSQDTRDFALEGRVRMERGLFRFEQEDYEGARDDLTWAETRLKSVAKASRDHDLAILNKAAFHLALGEQVMALQVYGEMSRKEGHANESIAISRLAAGRIYGDLGQMFDALRLLWISHAHAILAGQRLLAIEAGTTFVDMAEAHLSDDAQPMQEQVESAGPRNIGDEAPMPGVLRSEAEEVLEWCAAACGDRVDGVERPDLRAVALLSARYGRLDIVSHLIGAQDAVEDPMLCAVMQHVDDEGEEAWSRRMAQLTMHALDPQTEV